MNDELKGGSAARQRRPGGRSLSGREETGVELILLGYKNKPRSRRKETDKPQKQPKNQHGRQEVVYCHHGNVQPSAMEASGVTKGYIRLLCFRSAFVFYLLLLCGPPPHSCRCGPLGCLSTSRSDFDIC